MDCDLPRIKGTDVVNRIVAASRHAQIYEKKNLILNMDGISLFKKHITSGNKQLRASSYGHILPTTCAVGILVSYPGSTLIYTFHVSSPKKFRQNTYFDIIRICIFKCMYSASFNFYVYMCFHSFGVSRITDSLLILLMFPPQLSTN